MNWINLSELLIGMLLGGSVMQCLREENWDELRFGGGGGGGLHRQGKTLSMSDG